MTGKRTLVAVTAAVVLALSVGCVSKSKYDADMKKSRDASVQAAKDIAAATTATKAMQDEMSKKTADLATAQAQVADLTQQLGKVKAEVATATKAAADAKAKLAQATALNEKQAALIADLQKQLEAVKTAPVAPIAPTAPAPGL